MAARDDAMRLGRELLKTDPKSATFYWQTSGPQVVRDLVAALEAEGKAMRALEDLTPGGSEFVDNIENCVDDVKRYRESLLTTVLRMKRQRDTAQERVTALEGAQRAPCYCCTPECIHDGCSCGEARALLSEKEAPDARS